MTMPGKPDGIGKDEELKPFVDAPETVRSLRSRKG